MVKLGQQSGLANEPSAPFLVAAVPPILAEVGPFLHAPLDWTGRRSGPKKQTGRLLKIECTACGLMVRQTRK
jgi:hypothetical protein